MENIYQANPDHTCPT